MKLNVFSLSLHCLEPKRDYTVSVIAFNNAGQSEPFTKTTTSLEGTMFMQTYLILFNCRSNWSIFTNLSVQNFLKINFREFFPNLRSEILRICENESSGKLIYSFLYLAPVPSILIGNVDPSDTKMKLKWKDNKQITSNNADPTTYIIRLVNCRKLSS